MMWFFLLTVLLATDFPEITMHINQAKVDSADELLLVVEVNTSTEDEFTIGFPRAEGVTFTLKDKQQGRSVAGQIHIFRYGLKAEKGSYVIGPPSIHINGVERRGNNYLYIDIGGLGPTSELAPILERSTFQYSTLWLWTTGGLAVVFVLFWGWKQKEKHQISPHRKLKKQLIMVFSSGLSDREKAIEISHSFRHYLQSKSLGDFLSLTPKEVKEELLNQTLLSNLQREWALKILRTTDQIKYAGQTVDMQYWKDIETTVQSFVSSVELE